MKFCSTCNLEKPLSDFSKKGELGYQSICKKCHNDYCRSKYDKNPEYYKAKKTRRVTSIRQWFRDLKLETGCVICKENTYQCLDMHHLDPDEKEYNLSRLLAKGVGRDKIKKEFNKCIVLCANCHRKVHAGLIEIGV